LLKVPVSRCNNAHIHLDCAASTDAFKFPFLKHS